MTRSLDEIESDLMWNGETGEVYSTGARVLTLIREAAALRSPPAPPTEDEGARGPCPGCGRELTAADLEMARRKYAFRPGLTNNPGGWAAPITGECSACGAPASSKEGGR